HRRGGGGGGEAGEAAEADRLAEQGGHGKGARRAGKDLPAPQDRPVKGKNPSPQPPPRSGEGEQERKLRPWACRNLHPAPRGSWSRRCSGTSSFTSSPLARWACCSCRGCPAGR